jgi:hypothetical protein
MDIKDVAPKLGVADKTAKPAGAAIAICALCPLASPAESVVPKCRPVDKKSNVCTPRLLKYADAADMSSGC